MIGQRLKFERERLGKTQSEFAAIAGVGKTTVINWEKDDSSPTAVQLAALSEAGVDVFYVLTGQRVVSLPQPEPLTEEEIALVVEYRQSAPALKAAAHRILKPEETRPAPRMRSGGPVEAVPPVMRSGDKSGSTPPARRTRKGGGEP